MDLHGRLAILGLAGAITLPIPDGALTIRDRQQILRLPSTPIVEETIPDPTPDPADGMIQVISHVIEGGPNVFGTSYGGVLSAAGTGNQNMGDVVAAAGALRQLRVEFQFAPGTGKSWAVTLMKNGLATAMTLLVSDSATVGAFSTQDIDIAEGDVLSLRWVGLGTPTSSAVRWSVVFESTTSNQSLYAGPRLSGIVATYRTGVFTMPTWTTGDPTRVHSIAAAAGTITKLFCRIWNLSLPGGTTVTFHLWKNGVKQDGTGGTVNTGLVMSSASDAGSVSFSLSVVGGDRLYLEGIASGSNASFFHMGVQFTATTNGESQVCGTSDGLPTGDTSTTFVIPNALQQSWQTGETSFGHRIGGGLTAFTLKHLYVRLTQAPGTGDSWTFNPRWNGTNPSGGQTVTISGGSDVSGSDTTGFFDIPDETDLIGFRNVVSGSPASGTFAAWGMIQVTAAAVVPPPFPPETNNPPVGDPIGVIRVARFVIGGSTIVQRGEATIRNPSDLWDGKVSSGLLSISKHERELREESIPRASCTIVVDDTPDPITGECFWKGLAASDTLEGAYVEIDEHDAPYGITIGTPWRIFAGRVTRNGHRALDGFRYQFKLDDVVGEWFANPQNPPQIPGRPLTLAEFAGMNPDFDGKFPPRILGRAVQDGEGVVPMIVMGRLNPSTRWGLGGVDLEVGVGLLALGAVYDVLDLYYTLLTWEAEKAVFEGEQRVPATPDGFYYRVSTAGTTGATEPDPWTATTIDGTAEWTRVGPYDPNQRHRIPEEMYGVAGGLVVPHKPGWSTVTGFPNQYALDGTPERAWTPVLWDLSHPYSPYVEDGRITITADIIGAMNSPLSGTPLLDHVQLWAWVLLNLIWHDTDGKTYGNMPLLPGRTGDYSALDMEALDAAKARGDAMGGFIAGLVLAALGESEDGFTRLASFPRDGCFKVGINRHGQAFPARKDPTATATVVFDEVKDLLAPCEFFFSTERRGIGVEFEYGRRYIDVTPPPAAQPGQPTLRTGGRQPGEWASGLNRLPYAAAQSAQDASWQRTRTEPIPLEMDTVRDPATAQIIAEYRRDEGSGPGPAYHGIPMFRITVPWDRWKRLGTDGKAVDLNTYCAITTSEGFGPTGYVLQKGWITKVAPDPDAHLVTLEGEVIVAA